MKQEIIALFAVFELFVFATAQPTFNVSICVPGSTLTAFTNCNSLYSTLDTCNHTTTTADFTKFWCAQNVFNSIFGCESEQRLCFGNGDLDSQSQDLAASWHKGCDSRVSFTATTPAVSSITASYNDQGCTTYAASCASATSELSRCHTAYTASSDRSSCICAPQLQTWEYGCGYLGNVSCLLTTAALSNLPGYGFCSNFEQVLGGLPNATATDTASSPVGSLSTTSLTGSVTVARPTLSTSSVTATSTSAAGSITNTMTELSTLYLSFAILLSTIL